jgi:hypothetical protein
MNDTTDSAADTKPAADAAKPAANEWNGKILLRKPITANGEQMEELNLREPTAADIIDVGMPVTPDSRLDAPVIAMMISRLAAVPPSSVRSMHPTDFTNACYRLADFFVRDSR